MNDLRIDDKSQNGFNIKTDLLMRKSFKRNNNKEEKEGWASEHSMFR